MTAQTPQKNKGELARFLVSGCCAVGTDLTVYWLLLPVFSPSPAKAISFIAGTVLAFVLNKFWSFKSKKSASGEAFKFATLYTVTLGANLLVNRATLDLVPRLAPQIHEATAIAFFFATAASTVLNYLGQKFWVFKKA